MKKFIIVTMLIFLSGCSNQIETLHKDKGILEQQKAEATIEYNKLHNKITELDKQIKIIDKQINELKVKPLGSLGNKLLACVDCPNEILHSTGITTGDIQDNLITDRDKVLMSRICKHGKINGKTSPLCNNREMYLSGKKIFEDRGVPYGIALGIMFAESHLGINYAGTCNESWNNRGGIKWRMTDIGGRVKDQPIPNNGNGSAGGCRLYKFDSVQDYFKSKANTLSIGYDSCFKQSKPITCISYAYAGNRYTSEDSRVYRVSLIAE